MNKAYSKLIGVMAVVLLAQKGKAQTSNHNIDEDKISSSLSEILKSTDGQAELLAKFVALNKSQLEKSLKVTLTDQEFINVQQLVSLLMGEGINLKMTPAKNMILAAQEAGGGCRAGCK
jgi:hypothetical protein